MVDIRDQALSQQLPDLTLDKAKKHIRKKEAVRQQSDILKCKTDKPVSDLDKNINLLRNVMINPGNLQEVHTLWKAQHPQDKCPAKDVTCYITAVCVCQRRPLQIQYRILTQLLLVIMMTTVMTIFWEQWTQNRKLSG